MTKQASPICKKYLLLVSTIPLAISAYCIEMAYKEFIQQTYLSQSKIHSFLGTVYLTGIISPGDANKLQSVLSNDFISPSEIQIDSGGGDIYEAMKIGAIVKSKKLNIKIKYHCLSACANYIFPAAENKVIYEKSALGWHGSLGSNDDWFMQPTLDVSFSNGQFIEKKTTYSINSLPDHWKSRIDLVGHRKFQELEKMYFIHINTSNLIPLCGQMQNAQNIDFNSMTSKNGLPTDFFQSMKWHYFHYSISDLQKFGINNITLKGDETEWMKNQENSNSALAKFCKK